MWLYKRFNGVILPYKPLHEFKFEISQLKLKGYLKDNNDVVVDGIKIGSYDPPEHIKFSDYPVEIL